MRRTVIALFVVLAGLAALAEEAPSRRELLRRYHRSGELTIVFGVEHEANRARIEAAARGLGSSRLRAVKLLEARGSAPEALRGPVALVGTPRANAFVGDAASALPFALTEGGFRIGSESYRDPGDSLAVFHPSPYDRRYPLFLVTGNSDEAVLAALETRRLGDVQVRRRGTTLLLGVFEGGFEPERLRTRVLEPVTAPALTEPPVSYFVHDGADVSLAALANRQRELLRRVEALSGEPCSLGPIELHVYRSLEDKALATESTLAASWDGQAIRAASGRESEALRRLAERALDVCLPGLSTRARRGLALALVSTEAELDAHDRTARRLFETSEPPELWSLSDGESPFVRDALEASFARFVLAARAGRTLGETSRLAELEASWSRELRGGPDDVETNPLSAPSGFQHGFTFTHEGFRSLGGYLSSSARRSLHELRTLGVDAVAIVPYAFMRDPHRVEPLRVPTRLGSETDEDVAAAIVSARENGLTVLLKPQIWVRGSWPGAIDPVSETETAAFFREYRRFILHYALLAERYRVPLLAIGTELEALTRGHEPAWTSLIRDLRLVYHGELVYAANWGREVEQVGFWPLLDYIGVDFYYPLSTEAAPSDGELRAGLERALARLRALSERENKPVLLTEIGYASTEAPWREPHASDRSAALSLEDQARAYEAAFRAVARETSWVRGMYWWKWPSDLAVGGAEDRSFTPNGKPAAAVVRRWYEGRLQ